MKSLFTLWQKILEDSGIRCGISTTQDCKTALGRFEHEGVSFLTITLANFAKDFQKSLDAEKVDHDLFLGFSRKGGLPRFLGGFLDRVFDRCSGCLLNEPDLEAIFCIRQITMAFAKIELPCSPSREKAAFRSFVETEGAVKRSDSVRTARMSEDFSRLARLLFGPAIGSVSGEIQSNGIMPKHGPGATADRLKGNSKYCQSEWPARLEKVFPFWENAVPVVRHPDGGRAKLYLDPGQERPVKVTPVPKTLKTPRLIAIEPTAMQYVQQGIAEVLVKTLESDTLVGPLIGFSDQEPNRKLACDGSKTGILATLDLSEASDRVSNQHVLDLFILNPFLSECIQACRSRKADVPGHGVIRLAKYASMGSALTFPIEAMVFLVTVFHGIESYLLEKGELRQHLTRKDVRSFHGSVRIYGDDIIVPTDMVHHVVNSLEAFGFKVGLDKSYWNGQFRESCGGDYFAGEWVTPTRVRRVLPTRRSDAREIASVVSLRNQLYGAGFWGTAKWLDDRIRKLVPFPIVEPTSRVAGRVSASFRPSGEGWHDTLHLPLIRGALVRSRQREESLDGDPALLKYFLKRMEDPLPKEHLERYGRADCVRIDIGWAAPF